MTKKEIRKSKPKSKRKYVKSSARFARNILLENLNKSPVLQEKRMSFNYEFNFKLNTTLGEKSKTQLFDLQSPYDPDFTNNTRNASSSYWNTFMGNTTGLYEKFLVDRVEVDITSVAWSTSEIQNVVLSLTNKGDEEYQTDVSCSTIGQRPMATTFNTMKAGGHMVRKHIVIHPHKVHGVPKKDWTQKITAARINVVGVGYTGADVGYFSEYNQVSRTSSWIAITMGAQPSIGPPIVYPAGQVNFQGRITYHGIAYKPHLLQTTA